MGPSVRAVGFVFFVGDIREVGGVSLGVQQVRHASPGGGRSGDSWTTVARIVCTTDGRHGRTGQPKIRKMKFPGKENEREKKKTKQRKKKVFGSSSRIKRKKPEREMGYE